MKDLSRAQCHVKKTLSFTLQRISVKNDKLTAKFLAAQRIVKRAATRTVDG